MRTVTKTVFLLFVSVFLSCQTRNNNSATKTIQLDTITVYLNTTEKMRSRIIPYEVFQMTKLKVLFIQGMDCDYGDTSKCWMIREIPKTISNLKNLEILRLNLNALTFLPQEISALQNLKILDITDNPEMNNITNITTLTNLEELYLFGCNLDSLPSDIGQLKKLKHLGLTGNNLDSRELERIRKALPNCNITFEK
jgi:hypothetical protein